jgi:hypothetical protein
MDRLLHAARPRVHQGARRARDRSASAQVSAIADKVLLDPGGRNPRPAAGSAEALDRSTIGSSNTRPSRLLKASAHSEKAAQLEGAKVGIAPSLIAILFAGKRQAANPV